MGGGWKEVELRNLNPVWRGRESVEKRAGAECLSESVGTGEQERKEVWNHRTVCVKNTQRVSRNTLFVLWTTPSSV